MSIFVYLIVTLAGHKLVLGPGGGAPEAQGFWAINNGQMSIFLYLICDTGRSRIGWGVRSINERSDGAEPNWCLKLRGFGH